MLSTSSQNETKRKTLTRSYKNLFIQTATSSIFSMFILSCYNSRSIYSTLTLGHLKHTPFSDDVIIFTMRMECISEALSVFMFICLSMCCPHYF